MNKTLAGMVALLMAASGCDSDDSSDDSAAGTSTGGVVTTTTDSGPASSSGAADSSTGLAEPGLPTCVKTCGFPGECCPPGAEGCPSSSYPYGFVCQDSLCIDPECTSDAECGGTLSCLEIRGKRTCVQGCSDDAACADVEGDTQCGGVADAGEGYCFSPCTPGGGGCGNTDCDEATGRCTCVNSTQCIVGFECI